MDASEKCIFGVLEIGLEGGRLRKWEAILSSDLFSSNFAWKLDGKIWKLMLLMAEMRWGQFESGLRDENVILIKRKIKSENLSANLITFNFIWKFKNVTFLVNFNYFGK